MGRRSDPWEPRRPRSDRRRARTPARDPGCRARYAVILVAGNRAVASRCAPRRSVVGHASRRAMGVEASAWSHDRRRAYGEAFGAHPGETALIVAVDSRLAGSARPP